MKVRCAVVGVGYLGRFHAQKFNAASQLVAVVDADLARATTVAEELGVQPLSDYRDLMGLGVQCVSIASVTVSHFEIASFFLRSGVDVLVEKPITATVDEGVELVRLAKENGRVLQVGHLERFNPGFTAVRDLISEPKFFEVRRIAPFSGRAFDVDVVKDLMIHDLDLLLSIVKRPIVKIEAVGVPVITPTLDLANARILFEGGAVANITASRVASQPERTIKMFQSGVAIQCDLGKKSARISRIIAPESGLGVASIHHEEFHPAGGDALNDEILSFLACVETRNAPVVSGEDGLAALRAAEEICQIIEKNRAEVA